MTTDEADGGSAAGVSEWVPHLEELRRRIIAVLVIFVVAAAAAFAFSEHIAAFLMAPAAALGIQLFTFAPAEKFGAYLTIAVWTGAIAAAPFCLLQITLFVLPALRGRERRWTLACLTIIPILFFCGAALVYYYLAPVVLRFFVQFGAGDGVAALWSFKEYLSILYALALAAGLLLQTPLLLLAAFALGLISPKAAARARPAIILGIFIVAALCTPPDVVSQAALAVPLCLLFELTLVIGRVFQRRQK
ncbi:MAG: twin-arginine translocase subunit TatC [Spirochaetaceae bacterium]|jgi:sec-independent protein translocase protein TatC|nr:twin-arginine translocase subunit TatC [Spirochaetaceae bacterium]